MHEVLLIYRSKYGAAKAYAEMAAGRLGPRAYDTGGSHPLPDAAKIRGKKAGRHAGAVGAGAAGSRPGRRQLGRAPLPSAAALLSPIAMLEKQP